MGLYELIDYLVRLKLANHRKALCVLGMAANGEPTDKIYDVCNVSRAELKGYLSRAREKVGNGYKSLVIIKHVVPLLSDIQPIIVNNRCIICNTDLRYSQDALMHVRYRHRDMVAKYVDEVVKKLAKRMLETS